MKPHDVARAGRVVLKAHPCACNPIRAIHRASRKRLIRPALADRNGRVSQNLGHPPRSGGRTQRNALHAVDLHPVSRRRGGAEKARRVARMDSGQFAVSTGTCCQRTPEPTRAVVRLDRTTDPSGCHFSWLLLFGQAKRSDSLDAVERKHLLRGRREKRLTNLATAETRTSGVPQANDQPRSRRSRRGDVDHHIDAQADG